MPNPIIVPNAISMFAPDGVNPATLQEPLFDSNGSQSSHTPIDDKLLRNLMKNNAGSTGITPSNVDSYIENRARNQSTFDRVGNVFMQTLGEIVGGTLESTGSLAAIPWKLVGAEDAYTRNFLEQIGSSINEGTKETFPIYMTKQAQSGSLLDRMKGGGYWAQLTPSVFGSAVSIMLPARGASLMLGKLARGAVNIAGKNKYAKEVFNIASELQKAKALNRATKFADIYGSAAISRILDSSREAYGTYEQEKQWFLDNHESYVERDENGNAILKVPGSEEVPLNNENLDRIASEYADSAASKGFNLSLLNIGYDILEWSNIMGAAKTMSRATRENIRKAMANGDKFAVVRALNAIPSAGKREILRGATAFAGSAGAEMADEMTMSIAMNEGSYSARKDYGLLSDMDEASTFNMRLGAYLKDADIWTEGIGGLLGGAGMQTIMPIIERKLNKKGIAREAEYIKGIERATTAMRDGLDNIVTSLANGDIIGAKMQETQTILDQVAANTLDGSLAFYKEMLSNMSSSLKELQAIQDKVDRNESISADEQLALDKGKDLLSNVNYFDQLLNKIEAVEDIYDTEFNTAGGYTTDDYNSASYELARRRANLKAQKRLNEIELENLSNNAEEYQEVVSKSKTYLDDYINKVYTDETINTQKKVDLNNYSNYNTASTYYSHIIKGQDEAINKLKKDIATIESTLKDVPKSEMHTKGLSLKIALKSAKDRLDSYTKSLDESRKAKTDLDNKKKALNLTKEDLDAIQQSTLLIQNAVDPKSAKELYDKRNAILDAELDYYHKSSTFDDILNQIKLYKDEITASTNEDLKKELNTFTTAETLEKAKDKFMNDDIRKVAYKARLKRLKDEERLQKEAEARQAAALNAEKASQNNVENEETESDKDSNPFEEHNIEQRLTSTSLSDYAKLINDSIKDSAIVKGISFSQELNARKKDKNLIEQDKQAIAEIEKYYSDITKNLEDSFSSFQQSQGIDNIVLRLSWKYTLFEGINMQVPFDYIDAATNTEIVYNHRLYKGDIAAQLNHYLTVLSAYTHQVSKTSGTPLPAFMLEANFGTSETGASDINKLTNKIINEAKAIQNKFASIDELLYNYLGRKNPTHELYVSIGGIEHKVINTSNPRNDIGIALEGIEGQVNRYYLTPESIATPNDDYIIVTKRIQSAAHDLSLSSTGVSEVSPNITEQDKATTIEKESVVDKPNSLETEYVASDNTDDTISENIDFKINANEPLIDFKINGVNTSSMTEFISSLMSQDGVNLALFDTNILSSLVLIPKLLNHAKNGKKYTSDAFIKSLIEKYFTDAKLTKGEQLIVKVAKIFSDNVTVDITETDSYIKPSTNNNLLEAKQALIELKELYDKNSNNFENDMQSISDAINAIAETDMINKASVVLQNHMALIDPLTVVKKLDSAIKNRFGNISSEFSDIFHDNFSLFSNLVAFISDRNGFKINSVNYYDIIDGMREYRGDNYPNLVSEIKSIINLSSYLKDEFKNRADYYNLRWKETKNDAYKTAYNDCKFFADLIDTEATANKKLTEDEILDYINNNPSIRIRGYHEGLDIRFNTEGTSENVLANTQTNKLGLYEIIPTLQVGDNVTAVQTDLEENVNRASYDIMIERNGKQYKLGTIPKIESVVDGVAYVLQGANGVYNTRKFTLTDDMAKIFAEYQNELFRFMYNYDIAYNPRNNVSRKDIDAAERNIDLIFENFRGDRYSNLLNAFKELIYSNLSTEQIKTVMNSQTMFGIIDVPYTGSEQGEIANENVALSFNQIFQICTNLFDGIKLEKVQGRGIVNAQSIVKRFNDAVNRQELIFKNNQAIRNDIRMTGSLDFRISHISAGKVLINDAARRESQEAKNGLPINHSRNSLLDSIKPTEDAIDENGKPRVQVLYIDENGKGKDLKTGGIIDLSKFATPHVGDQFITNRGGIVVVIPQTNSINTIFPTAPNTIMGSITDDNEDARLAKLNKYNSYISNVIKQILDTKTGNIKEKRLDLSNRLQNVVICNESSDPAKNDIYFQSDNSLDGSQRSVLIKAVLGEGKDKNVYNKFIQKEIEGREAIIYYKGTNKLDVANYNGALNSPSYSPKIYYLDSASDMQKLDNVLNGIIPNMVRQFGAINGIATSKDGNASSYTTGYTDPILGETYNDIYDYYMNTNARYSDVAYIKDKYGEVVSNVSVSGNSPIKFSIATKSFDSSSDEYTQRFYDPVKMLKTVQDAKRHKEDWSNIAKLANILEYEAGISPVYVKHVVKNNNITTEGSADAVKLSKSTDILPTGFHRNLFRIDINYNPVFASVKGNENYLTRTLAHEMLHVYMYKFFNITQRELNNKEIVAKKEALIHYNNEEFSKWIVDLAKAVEVKRNELSTKSELNSNEEWIANAIGEKGFVNKLITVLVNEAQNVNTKIDELLEARENGADVVLTGKQAIHEAVTYALTNPDVYRLLNELQSTEARAEGQEQIETPTIWQKFKEVLLNIFKKIFDFNNTEVKTDSLLERLNDTIDRIYSKDFRDMAINTESLDITRNFPIPGRDKGEVMSGASSESAIESETTTEVASEVTTSQPASDIDTSTVDTNDMFGDINVGGIDIGTDTDIKASVILNNIYQSVDNLNKDVIFDDSKKIIC